jgi:hypothetical protein
MTACYPKPSKDREVLPCVSFIAFTVSLLNIMAPVSILSMKKVVTPVLVSPFISAQLIGADRDTRQDRGM